MWKVSHTEEVPGLTVHFKNIMVKRNKIFHTLVKSRKKKALP